MSNIFLIIIGVIILLIGIILGSQFKYYLYKIFLQFKNYFSNHITAFVFSIISLLIGFVIGIFIKNIDTQAGTLAEWISGLSSSAAVIVSLWLASGRLSKLKVCHSIQKNINHVNGQKIVNKKVFFKAYNKSDIPVTLEFYGYRKNRNEIFSRPGYINFEPKKINSGSVLSYWIKLNEIKQSLNLNNYNGNIEICFAEPDGNQHTEIINWNKLVKDLDQLNAK